MPHMRTPKTQKAKRAYTLARMSGENRSKSAIIAGLDVENLTRNDDLALLPKLVKDEGAKNEATIKMTREQVMQGLMDAADMARLAGEPMAMVSAWKEIGRMCGYYAPDVTKKILEIGVSESAKKALALLPDDDLYRFAHAKIVKGETLGPVSPEPARIESGSEAKENNRPGGEGGGPPAT